MCSRVLWTAEGQPVLVGRNMDGTEKMGTKLYVMPKGLGRQGRVDTNPIEWTFGRGTLPSTGIPHVIVNGSLVVKDSEVLEGADPGQPIRFEPVTSRFQPLSIASWTKTFHAAPIDFGGGVPGVQPDVG